MRYGFVTMLIGCSISLSGCGPTSTGDAHLDLAQQGLAAFKQLNHELEQASDISAFGASKSAIEARHTELNEIASRMKQLPAPAPDVLKALEAYDTELSQEKSRHSDAMFRILGMDGMASQAELYAVASDAPLKFLTCMSGQPGTPTSRGPGVPSRRPAGMPEPTPPPGVPGGFPQAGSPPARPDGSPPPGPGGPPRGDASQRPSIEERAQPLIERFGAEKVVIVYVSQAPFAAHRELVEKLKQWTGVANSASRGSGSNLAVVLAPVDDLDALASKIDFGQTTVDKASRTIDVTFAGPK